MVNPRQARKMEKLLNQNQVKQYLKFAFKAASNIFQRFLQNEWTPMKDKRPTLQIFIIQD